ncbi:MAG: phosphoglycolate phosphatase [Zoogloeaceae bacterium]|nr:phosphoglycolate phosphatase [Zoogloeaceae bacterium]
MKRLRAVTLDLDGTLLDTAPDLAAACNRMLAAMGFSTRSTAEIRRFVGTGAETLVTRCLSFTAPPSAAALEQGINLFRRFYAEENGRAATPYPQVRQGLAALRALGLPLAVVTNKHLAFATPVLARTGLAEFFAFTVGGDSTPHKKPHPEPLLHACRLLEVAPQENLHIGDSIHDARAARAAGCQVWLLPYGYTEEQPFSAADCDRCVPDLLAASRALAGVKK